MPRNSTRYEMLDFISRFIKEYGYAPSLREIAEGIGLAAVSNVHHHLKQLEEEGYIRRAPGAARSIVVLKGES